MKTLTLSLLILASTSLLSNELSWVDDQVEAIKPPRTGMKSSVLSGVKDPFIFLIRKDDKDIKTTVVRAKPTIRTHRKTQRVYKPSKVLMLKAVMNNSALINGKWYKSGDTINGYKVMQVNRFSVLLNKKKKELLLTTQSSSKKLNFKNN